MERILIHEDNVQFSKYKITYDESQVYLLKTKILERCCPIVKHQENRESSPELKWAKNVRRGKKVGIHEYGNGLEEPVYEYTYEEYQPTTLVLALSNLLTGEKFDINDLRRPVNIISPLERLDQEIDALSKEIDEIENIEVEKKISKLRKLQKLLEIRKVNSNLVSEDEYYEKISQIIKSELLETLKKVQIRKICSFFEDYTVPEFSDIFQRNLKK